MSGCATDRRDGRTTLGMPALRRPTPEPLAPDPVATARAAAASEAAGVPDRGPLVDRYGRVHRDLRISLTDRCSLRCTYCMPAEGVPWLERDSILTTPELERMARIAASLGIVEVRLTGGEPLLRPDVVDVVRRITAIRGVDGPLRVSVTTNGLRLPKLMDELVDAGLERLNISLDTLRRDRFAELTRRDRLDDVLEAIDIASRSGLRPLKINTVAMRGVNDDECADLLRYAVSVGAELRFIEQMPLDAGHTWTRAEMVTREELLDALGAEFSLTPVGERGAAPAELFEVDGGPTTVGVIASVTAPFCGACDRVRLTADGQLRNCLFSREESDVTSLLRAGADDDTVAARVRACIEAKLPGHGINEPGFLQPTGR